MSDGPQGDEFVTIHEDPVLIKCSAMVLAPETGRGLLYGREVPGS